MHTPHTLYLGGEKVEMGISILIQELELRALNKAIEQSIWPAFFWILETEWTVITFFGLKLYEKHYENIMKYIQGEFKDMRGKHKYFF